MCIRDRLCVLVGRLRARSEHRGAEHTDRLTASLDYIHRNYCEEIPIARLAQMEHLSASQYRAVFRSVTGVSPRGYVTMPVSYTHLDVYKRQYPGTAQGSPAEHSGSGSAAAGFV